MSEMKVYSGEDILDRIDIGDKIDLAYINKQFVEKSEADEVISELKDKCNMHNFFWEGCGFAKRGFKNTIAVSEAFDKLESENAELKAMVAQLEDDVAFWKAKAKGEM